MNKEELLNKAIKLDYNDLKLITGIYIIQNRKLHDSGYRLMTVIGHDHDYDNYYMISNCCSDVIDFVGWMSSIKIEDLHLDINRHGLIHIWSNNSIFSSTFYNLSNCILRVVKTNSYE